MNHISATVCVVDDDVSAREAVERLLQAAGLKVETYASAHEFLARSSSGLPGCLILDVELPGLSGLELQEELARAGVDVPIVFLTGHGNIPMTVRALKAGAQEFLTKPFDADELLNAIRQGISRHSGIPLQSTNLQSGGFVGETPSLRKVLRQIDLVAGTDATVLITGESGTGKELVARAIHERSPRRDGPLITVNCGAFPESLFESEFFGYVRGAFTGAQRDKPGRFELANGGTIFLDEIGALPLAMQAKLLRVLQEHEVERIGDTRARKLDVRIVAATNRDLDAAIRAGDFRQDLFYRLGVFLIENPPLRERREDIPRLAEHFIRAAAKRLNQRAPKLTEPQARQLTSYDWPGNIRELQNVIERAVILADGGSLQFHNLIPRDSTSSSPSVTVSTSLLTRDELKQRERESIIAALTQTGGKVSGSDGAAALLGMKSTTLYSRIAALGLRGKTTPNAWESKADCTMLQDEALMSGTGESLAVTAMS
jgi:DNA-binding NtrC family response regulator